MISIESKRSSLKHWFMVLFLEERWNHLPSIKICRVFSAVLRNFNWHQNKLNLNLQHKNIDSCTCIYIVVLFLEEILNRLPFIKICSPRFSVLFNQHIYLFLLSELIDCRYSDLDLFYRLNYNSKPSLNLIYIFNSYKIKIRI